MTCDFSPFNNISVISGRWEGNNEWQFPMGPRQRLERFSPQGGIDAGIKPETARSAGHHLI